MKPLRFLLPATLSYALLAFLSSCGEGHDDHDHSDDHGDSHEGDHGDSVLDLLENGDGHAPDPHAEHASGEHATNSVEDAHGGHGLTLEDLSPEPSIADLLHETPSVSVEATPGAGEQASRDSSAATPADHHAHGEETLPHLPASETEQALLAMEQSLTTQIGVLKKTIAEKDGKIATLTRFNEQLRTENSRLRRKGTTGSLDAPISGDAQVLQDQITRLKNDLALLQKANFSLQEHNKALRERHGGAHPNPRGTNGDHGPEGAPVEPSVVAPTGHSGKLGPSPTHSDSPTAEPPAHASAIAAETDTGTLAFNAVVTASNGKIKEAFYTEFFIAKKSLDEILKAGGIHLDEDKFPGVSSHAELWARSRKDPFRFPNLQKQIRETLLNHVESNDGHRIRTNIDGHSEEIKDVAAERHHVIGTATLGKVGVTWDVPVTISSGKHTNLSLTLANASWRL